MLRHLYIKNFALIDTLDIDFQEGFSVITGETGAGKSIILGALNLLLGQRADCKMIKMGAQKCVIEAEFSDFKDLKDLKDSKDFKDLNDLNDLILRREISANGKSRAFIDDSPVQLAELKAVGSQLIDIHSQHQNLLLNDAGFQLNVVDTIAKDTELLNKYKSEFKDFQTKRQEVESLKKKIEEGRREEDYLRYQQEKLSEIQLQAGMQEELEKEQELLSNVDEIKSQLYEADAFLSGADNVPGVVDNLKQVSKILDNLLSIYSDAEELSERIESAYIEIKDIASELSDAAESIDDNPRRLEEINETLDKIYSLEKKYNLQTVEELIAYKQEIDEKLLHIDNSDEELHELTLAMNASKEKATETAKLLSETRAKAAQEIEEKMLAYLIPLGIPKVQFKVEISETKELTPAGMDNIQFLFSANSSTALSPVSQVASGGEIARVMLSLKAMMATSRTEKNDSDRLEKNSASLPTIIFDEIDTGVSGKIAEKMALIMEEIAAEKNGRNGAQAISITHLPQIAAKGKTHYKVMKEETVFGTVSQMTRLSLDERVLEIAQMLSGSDISDAAIDNAKELLRQ